MSITKIKNGLSTGLGYVGSVPQSDNAEKATNDSKGQNIYNTYGNFASALKSYSGETLAKGVYIVTGVVAGSRASGIIEYEAVTDTPYSAFLGVGALESGTIVYYRACIKNGILEFQGSQDGKTFTKYTSSTPSYKKLTQ